MGESKSLSKYGADGVGWRGVTTLFKFNVCSYKMEHKGGDLKRLQREGEIAFELGHLCQKH